jgi:hypothetical protein
MNLSEEFNNVVNKAFVIVDSNKVVYTVIGLFLALYAALAAPVLPPSVTKIFKNTWFKLAFMFLIGYMATKNASVAIISSVALLVTLQTLASQETTDIVVAAVESKIESNIEKFENNIADVDYHLLSNNYQTHLGNHYSVDNVDDYIINESEDDNFEGFETTPSSNKTKVIIKRLPFAPRKNKSYTAADLAGVVAWTKERYPKLSNDAATKLATKTLQTSNHSLDYLKGNSAARNVWKILQDLYLEKRMMFY